MGDEMADREGMAPLPRSRESPKVRRQNRSLCVHRERAETGTWPQATAALVGVPRQATGVSEGRRESLPMDASSS